MAGTKRLIPKTVCATCGHRVVPGEGWCFGCDTLNPSIEVEEDDGDRDTD